MTPYGIDGEPRKTHSDLWHELAELSGTFKMLVIETMLAQAELDHRLAYLRKIAAMDCDYLKPKKTPH